MFNASYCDYVPMHVSNVFIGLLVAILTTVPRAAPTPTRRNILLRAEAKTGTTFLEIILFEAAKRVCTSSKSCSIINENTNAKRKIEFVNHSSGVTTAVLFSRKHALSATSPQCEHINALAPAAPCNLQLSYNQSIYLDALQDFEDCLRICTAAVLPTPDWEHLHLSRDPRDVVVSRCFHEINSELSTTALEECVKKKYVNTLYWVKLREMMIPSNSRCDTICYERLTTPNESEKYNGYTELTSFINLQATEKNIRDIIRSTSINSVKEGGGYSIIYGSNKFREGAARNFMSYGIDLLLIDWMNDLYNSLESRFPSPCARYRWEWRTRFSEPSISPSFDKFEF